MSTRSSIGMINPDGTVSAIYCHYDGYPEYNGEILKTHYTLPSKVSELINLGALSILKERTYPIGTTHSFDTPEELTTVAYHRDRGEEYYPPKVYPDKQSYYEDWDAYDAEYMYLFNPVDEYTGNWNYKDVQTGKVHRL